MSSRSDQRLGPDPRSHPAGYPGQRLTFDYLLRGDRVLALPVGRSAVLADRLAVVAFGSNAAPAQLMAKFGPAAGDIPVTRARLRGFALGHSPHVSIPGYVPWVLVDRPGSVVDCAVLWLDQDQRVRLDATEPNYTLVEVDAASHPLVVDDGDASSGYLAYRGRWGALRWPDDLDPAPAVTQAVLFRRLAELVWFRDLLGAGALGQWQRRLAADSGLRHRVRDELAERRMVSPDRWTRPAALTG